MASPALYVRNLLLARAGRIIAQRLSFALAPGQALAVQGANGSGKSSLLRALAGLLPPAGGAIEYHPPFSRPHSIPFHYIGHENAISPALSLGENLHFAALALGQNPPSMATMRHWLDFWQLRAPLSALAASLSAGQKRKLALMRLDIVPAPLWLLDEPAASLDAPARAKLAQRCRAQLEAGGMVAAARYDAIGLPEADVAIEIIPRKRGSHAARMSA